ncbi:MAG: T9SS type A sorting domain-containing protein [Bacteroidetes bacterium]|nr:T9SS type A sorting domain-containing protein [Bacteroidota bacterium]
MKKFVFTLIVMLLVAAFAHSQTPELVVPIWAENLASANGSLFFSKSDTLMISDGTTAGTHLLKQTGNSLVEAGKFTAYNGKTYFIGADTNGGVEMWVTDGTTSGTNILTELNPSGSGCIDIFGAFNGKLYFIGNDGINGKELWQTDGTALGTQMVKDINPGNGNGITFTSNINWQIGIYNGKLYFSANNGTNGDELWASDGTMVGTTMVKDINSAGSSNPRFFTVANGKLFFEASSDLEGSELWVSDGTGSNTTLVKDINPGPSGSSPAYFTSYNGKVYFTTSATFASWLDPNNLWESDGTPGGTVIFQDSAAQMTCVYNGHLYLGKISGYKAPFFEYALYKSDGTHQGTTLLSELPGGHSTNFNRQFIEVGSKLYFLCNYNGPNDSGNQLSNDLWVTDGTPANTKLIQHASGDSVNVLIYTGLMAENNGSLFFVDQSTYTNSLYKISGNGTGISDVSANNTEVLVYPNPTHSDVNIQTDEPVETINIYNAMGALVQTETQTTFSISAFHPGIYLLQIKTGKGTAVMRIAKY